MSLEVRHAPSPAETSRLDTDGLRHNFLVDDLFRPGEIRLTYWHVDRLVVGGATPLETPLALKATREIGQATFLARREIGIVNIGGAGRITVDGDVFELSARDCLYVGMGKVALSFESIDAAFPAKFYLLSAPAHASHPTRLIRPDDARQFSPGEEATANKRNVFQYILPGVCDSCQLVLGITELQTGNVWNTMPTHTHERRSEVYLYFDLPENQRVVHLMGQPHETRHIVMSNEDAVLSPSWSIHSGVGTSAYAFIWGMAGDNMDYADMDMVAIGDLR